MKNKKFYVNFQVSLGERVTHSKFVEALAGCIKDWNLTGYAIVEERAGFKLVAKTRIEGCPSVFNENTKDAFLAELQEKLNN